MGGYNECLPCHPRLSHYILPPPFCEPPAAPPTCALGVSEGLVQTACACPGVGLSLPGAQLPLMFPQLPSTLDASFMGQGHGIRLNPQGYAAVEQRSGSKSAKSRVSNKCIMKPRCHFMRGN